VNFDKVRETMARGWVCSDEKLRASLGYAPQATLEERFAETVAWYREHSWL
jgi:nucleoside-diphosphate-sugar epimerase